MLTPGTPYSVLHPRCRCVSPALVQEERPHRAGMRYHSIQSQHTVAATTAALLHPPLFSSTAVPGPSREHAFSHLTSTNQGKFPAALETSEPGN